MIIKKSMISHGNEYHDEAFQTADDVEEIASQTISAVMSAFSWKDNVNYEINYVSSAVPTGAAEDGEFCLDTTNEKLYEYVTDTWTEQTLSEGDRLFFKDDGTDESGDSGTYTANGYVYEVLSDLSLEAQEPVTNDVVPNDVDGYAYRYTEGVGWVEFPAAATQLTEDELAAVQEADSPSETNPLVTESAIPDLLEYSSGDFQVKGELSVGNTSGDPYTKALLHFEGDDGSQVFTDDAGNFWEQSGSDIELDTSVKKFGTACVYNTSDGDKYLFSSSDDFIVGTDDFTIETWFYRTASFNALYVFFEYEDIKFSMLSNASGSTPLPFYCDAAGETYTHYQQMSYSTWHHAAVVGNGSSIKFYLDGILIHTEAYEYDFDSNTIKIAQMDGGRMDEFRFSVGTQRYTENFAPASEAFSDFEPTGGIINLQSPSDIEESVDLTYEKIIAYDAGEFTTTFYPPRESAAAEPTLEVGQMKIWYDSVNARVVLLYNDATAGQVSVQMS